MDSVIGCFDFDLVVVDITQPIDKGPSNSTMVQRQGAYITHSALEAQARIHAELLFRFVDTYILDRGVCIPFGAGMGFSDTTIASIISVCARANRLSLLCCVVPCQSQHHSSSSSLVVSVICFVLYGVMGVFRTRTIHCSCPSFILPYIHTCAHQSSVINRECN